MATDQTGSGSVVPKYNGVAAYSAASQPRQVLRNMSQTETLTVLDDTDGEWLKVRLPDGIEAFVRRNTVAPPPAPVATPSPPPPQAARPVAPVAASGPAAFCGSCGRALAQNTAFCGGCGAPVAGSTATPQPTAPPQWQTQSPTMSSLQPSMSSLQNPDYIGYVVCCALLAISAFLPWEVVDVFLTRVNGNGLDVNRGWLVLIAALVAGGAAAWGMFQPVSTKLVRVLVIGCSIVAVGMALLEFNVISDYCSGKEACEISPGIGVFVAFLAGVVLFGLSLFRPPTLRSVLLVVLVPVVGIGIEAFLRYQARSAAPAQS